MMITVMKNATLIDGTSAAGRAYAARVTPHMFVIDPAGNVLYRSSTQARPMVGKDLMASPSTRWTSPDVRSCRG